MCDQHFDCPDGEDERNCNIDEMQIFKCTDERSYIQLYRRCDSKKISWFVLLSFLVVAYSDRDVVKYKNYMF